MRGKPVYYWKSQESATKKQKQNPLELKIGELVLHTTYYPTGFGNPSEEPIVNIIKKFDENTGKPYNVYEIKGGQQFDGRTGMPLTPPLAYCIKKI